MRTITQWTDLVRWTVRGVTDDQAAAIAQQCIETEKRGDHAGPASRPSRTLATAAPSARCAVR